VNVDVLTFGCRLNAYESEVIRENAAAAGLADVVVVNSCAVTAEAERQARQAIRRSRRERPQARVIVTGCAAQTNPDSFAVMAEVDKVVGNDAKMRASTWSDIRREFRPDSRPETKTGSGVRESALSPGIAEATGVVVNRSGKIAVGDIMAAKDAPHFIDRMDGRVRAYVQVQNGCDHRCTFCIIPFGRGNSRSLPMDVVIDQVRRLVENGYREVVLTGVDLTSYGADLKDAPRLGALVRQILRQASGLARLRLSSLDCIEIDSDLIAALAEEERLMPHLHLSLQAGDDLVLKRMKRRHSRGEAVALCAALRRVRPDLVFGADFIAGFPTETDEMFRRSLDLVDECGLTRLHVFPYSARPGTPAARMPQVARDVVKERAARLRRHGEAALHRHLDGEVGAWRRVLIETPHGGHSEHFTPVAFAEPLAAGAIIDAHIAGHDGRRLVATARSAVV
jgi:threonylcarbamoyladenosine tRNA methylthiotransferase MtaB